MKTTHGIKGKYTCINIINKLLEFMSLTPDPNDWFLDKQQSNPPRYMLLQQILALMDAFEIEQNKEDSICENYYLNAFFRKSSFGQSEMEQAKGEQRRLLQFIAGGFTRIKKPEDSPIFMDVLKKYMDENGTQFHLCLNMTNHMPKLFAELLAYKRQVYELLHFNGVCLAAWGLCSFTMQLTDASAQSIDTHDLDDVLESIVNPSALIFTEEELIANYQFPSEAEYRETQLEWI